MRNEKGFSIVEMMITMLIFLIVIGSVYGLLQVGFVDRNRASRHANILKNARVALHLIGRDALNAGLSYNAIGAVVPDDLIQNRLGLPPDGDNNRDFLTAIIAGNNINPNSLNPNPSARTDIISFAYRDMAFNNGNPISLVDAVAGTIPTDVALITNPGGANNANVFDLYLVESDSSQVAVVATNVLSSLNRIVAAPGDPLGINQPLNGSGINGSLLRKCNPPLIVSDCTTYAPASAKRFFWVFYRVRPDGTLVRVSLGNNTGAAASQQIQEMPIAYNVEDFQVQYLLANGRVSDDPIAGPDGIRGNADDNPLAMNDVRQINVTIRVQSPEIDEQTRQPMRITLTASFSTRNVLYDAG
ncbi:MAG: prepilin-type N-terminal cleavage/methylation domain-containing protein [Acidobacteriota bacterium]|nr:prepilin-type N-terminal cleavage/methylation domain-containing protein [Pyrinomonadaceae bacterium]MDW8304033.1 prepilin-type N-terminal cleavage/methylation domain-containing protein [Acidobacteriota bacterium]